MKILGTTITDMRRVILRADPHDPQRETFTVGGRNFTPNEVVLEYFRTGSAPWRFLSAEITGQQVKAGGELSDRTSRRSYNLSDAPVWLRDEIGAHVPEN